MKLIIALSLVLASQVSVADTLREKRIKKEMVDRVERLILTTREIRASLKTENVVDACAKVKVMFELYPEHMEAMASHMDLDKKKNTQAIREAVVYQMALHRQSNLCDKGEGSEYVDMELLESEIRVIGKTLEKHRKLIKKGDTDRDNNFSYEYSF